MGTYVTIYKWKPERVKDFGKKWLDLAMGTVPKELQEALKKFENLQIFYSIFNSCIVAVYDVKNEDMIVANQIALYLTDVCELETFPVLNNDDYAKSAEGFMKIFPDYYK